MKFYRIYSPIIDGNYNFGTDISNCEEQFLVSLGNTMLGIFSHSTGLDTSQNSNAVEITQGEFEVYKKGTQDTNSRTIFTLNEENSKLRAQLDETRNQLESTQEAVDFLLMRAI